MSPFKPLAYFLQTSGRFRNMTVDYCILGQVEPPGAATMSDVVSFQGQINKATVFKNIG